MSNKDYTKKANYSMMLNDGYNEDLKVYRGYAIDPEDKRAFNSEQQVDEYLNQLLEEMSMPH